MLLGSSFIYLRDFFRILIIFLLTLIVFSKFIQAFSMCESNKDKCIWLTISLT
jgi:hypothetical protein